MAVSRMSKMPDADEPDVDPIRVVVTGAAGRIGQHLTGLIASGETFGAKQPIILNLFDVPEKEDYLQGIAMELWDLASDTLHDVKVTVNPMDAFKDVSAAILLSSVPYHDGVDRKHLINQNGLIMFTQAQFLDQYALKTCKILVVTRPPNTMAYICWKAAPSLKRDNFVAMSRLDWNRATTALARFLQVSPTQIRNVIIWGNHSETAYPDFSRARITADGVTKRVFQIPGAEAYVRGPLTQFFVNRSEEVLDSRGIPAYLSAAKSASDAMHDWYCKTPPGVLYSMALCSQGEYELPEDIFYSFPVETRRGRLNIIKSIKVDDIVKIKMQASAKELLEERMYAESLLRRETEEEEEASEEAGQEELGPVEGSLLNVDDEDFGPRLGESISVEPKTFLEKYDIYK